MIRTAFRVIAAALCALSTAPAVADTLVDNIQGSTLDREGRLAHFTGLLIDAEGRISKVLGPRDKRPKKPDYLVDGKGRFVLPGMIDANIRLMPLALGLLAPSQGGALPVPRPEDRDVAFAKVQRLLAAQGYTAVADMGTTMEDWQTYRRAGDNGTLYLRVMAYAGDIQSMALIAGPRPTPWLYADRLRLNGLHMSVSGPDGSAYNDTQLRNVMSRAAMDGFQLSLAARDRKQVATALAAYAELAETYKGDLRWRIEQVTDADPADFAAYAVQGVAVTTAPDGWVPSAPTAPDALTLSPWRSLLAAKVPLAFGSAQGSGTQGTVIVSPFVRLAIALAREGALTRDQAQAALTADAARAGFADGRFGRLLEGERADFIVLDRDLLLAPPAELRTMRVLETWIGGRKIYDAAMAAREAQGPGQSLKAPDAADSASAPATVPAGPAPLPAPARPSDVSR